jgi:hypothetical protein
VAGAIKVGLSNYRGAAAASEASTGIVLQQSLFEIGGVADAVLGRLDEAFQNAGVKHNQS